MTKEQMIERLRSIHELVTVTGVRYTGVHITKKAKMVNGVRESSGKVFTINLDQLYDAYLHASRLTTPEVKKYIFMGHSPALAILRILREESTPSCSQLELFANDSICPSRENKSDDTP